MSRTEPARPRISQIAHGRFRRPDEAPRRRFLVWRVRLWLLALAAVLLAAHAERDDALLAKVEVVHLAQAHR